MAATVRFIRQMTIARGALPRRAAPDPNAIARYRAQARAARERRSGGSPRWLVLVAWPVMAVLGIGVLIAAGSTVGVGVDMLRRDLEGAIANAFPAAVETTLELERAGGSVQVELVISELPDFTTQRAVMLQGHVPSFALREGRTVEILLNGSVLATAVPDAAGRFAQQLVLRDGENSIVLTLLDGDKVIATTSATSVLDTAPPQLTVVRPLPGAQIEGENVVVEGKTEAGARVTVNGRVVVAAPDGSFSESFTAVSGPLAIEIVTRDQAGNETRQRVDAMVKPAAAAGARVGLSLDRTRVRPGEAVVAEGVILENGQARAGVPVTLFVGVVQIGSARTDASGIVRIGFAAPTTEGEIGIVMIGENASGRTTLTVAR